MTAPTARRLGFAVTVDRAGRAASVEGASLDVPESWAPEHLVLARAERDCFVGASLRVSPRYSWRVNGQDVA